MHNMQWLVENQFDTLLLKYWPSGSVDRLISVLKALADHSVIVDLLTPNVEKATLFANNSLMNTIRGFQSQENACDRYAFCQNVSLHSKGLRCVTAAGIRWRLEGRFLRIPLLHDDKFQDEAMARCRLNVRRRNIGVLVLDLPTDANFWREHAMRHMFDHFYLYTTPTVDVANADGDERTRSRTVKFIAKQICYNADCLLIFVDEILVSLWQGSDETVRRALDRAIGGDLRIRLVVISLCEAADTVTVALGNQYRHSQPALLTFGEFMMAPSGGLVAFIERSCRLSFSNTCLKYMRRGRQVLDMFSSTGTQLNPAP